MDIELQKIIYQHYLETLEFFKDKIEIIKIKDLKLRRSKDIHDFEPPKDFLKKSFAYVLIYKETGSTVRSYIQNNLYQYLYDAYENGEISGETEIKAINYGDVYFIKDEKFYNRLYKYPNKNIKHSLMNYYLTEDSKDIEIGGYNFIENQITSIAQIIYTVFMLGYEISEEVYGDTSGVKVKFDI